MPLPSFGENVARYATDERDYGAIISYKACAAGESEAFRRDTSTRLRDTTGSISLTTLILG